MPWQQHVADVILEIDPVTGRLAYSEFGLTVPRQSGKSTFIGAKSAHRCTATAFFGSRQRLVYTAQTRAKAREKWEEDFAADLLASPVFKARVRLHLGNGNEHMRFTNGSRFGIEAGTEKAGHGGTLDEAYIDEAFSQPDSRLEQAFGPAMITRSNKQLGWISTAGWLNGSPYLEEKVRVGRAAVAAGRTSGLAYFEWSADPDADPADPATWWACMPALGHTITEDAIRAEYEKAVDADKLNDFKRAYLNLWVPKPMDLATGVIGSASWEACSDPGSTVDRAPWFALDVAPDRGWAAIAVAGMREDDVPHVEVTSRGGLVDHREGVDWVVPRLGQLLEAFPDMVLTIVKGSAAGTLVPAIRAAGIDVNEVPEEKVSAACGLMYDLAITCGLRHLGQAELTQAVKDAARLWVGDKAFKWGRRKSESDITPLYAATLALWALMERPDIDPSIYFL